MSTARKVQQLFDLTGKTALVTGGSRGLGLQMTHALGDDEDLKGVTLLFASEAGKHITGQILPVDGGVSAMTGG